MRCTALPTGDRSEGESGNLRKEHSISQKRCEANYQYASLLQGSALVPRSRDSTQYQGGDRQVLGGSSLSSRWMGYSPRRILRTKWCYHQNNLWRSFSSWLTSAQPVENGESKYVLDELCRKSQSCLLMLFLWRKEMRSHSVGPDNLLLRIGTHSLPWGVRLDNHVKYDHPPQNSPCWSRKVWSRRHPIWVTHFDEVKWRVLHSPSCRVTEGNGCRAHLWEVSLPAER